MSPGVVGGFKSPEIDQPERGENRYTVFLVYSDEGGEWAEEIDVNARTEAEALALGKAEAEEFYQPGYVRIFAEERFGLYF